MEIKICTQCQQEKILDDFSPEKKMSDGKSSRCKKCNNERTKRWCQDHRKERYEKLISLPKEELIEYRKKDCAKTLKSYRKRISTPEGKEAVAIKNRKQTLKAYDLTLEDFNIILKFQDFKCAICDTSEPKGTNDQWHVDHDHKTGKIRGLLCDGCNRGLGIFKDNRFRLTRAEQYLTRSENDGDFITRILRTANSSYKTEPIESVN